MQTEAEIREALAPEIATKILHRITGGPIAPRDAELLAHELLAITISRLAPELAETRLDLIAFAGPAAAQWAREHGLAEGELHPAHFDLLARAGARMDDYRRAVLEPGEGAA